MELPFQINQHNDSFDILISNSFFNHLFVQKKNLYPTKHNIQMLALKITRIIGQAKYFTPIFQQSVESKQKKSFYKSLYKLVELERTIEQLNKDYQLTKLIKNDESLLRQVQIYLDMRKKHREKISNINNEVNKISKELQNHLDLNDYRNRRKFLHFFLFG